MYNVNESLSIINNNISELLVFNNFVNKISDSYKNNCPLRIKFGLDPTAIDLHFGHVVILNKLRQLQDLGHKIIFLIGDFTATIGDPSGCNITRPQLTYKQIQKNFKNYFSQINLILNISNIEFRYNSEWYNLLGNKGIIQLTSYYNVARMIERKDFTKRLKLGHPISIHEFIYPLIQAYDSVMIKSDLEIGGSDQKFNFLVGRELQKSLGQNPQCILTMPLLEGLNEINKMSKSKKNYISIIDNPNIMFSKIMSISDKIMWRYYKLLLLYSNKQIFNIKKTAITGNDFKNIKIKLALKLVTKFHSLIQAKNALSNFINYCNKGIPEFINTFCLSGAPLLIGQLLKNINLCSSISEALRFIDQGVIRINGLIVKNKSLRVNSGIFILQIGKRKFAKIKLTK